MNTVKWRSPLWAIGLAGAALALSSCVTSEQDRAVNDVSSQTVDEQVLPEPPAGQDVETDTAAIADPETLNAEESDSLDANGENVDDATFDDAMVPDSTTDESVLVPEQLIPPTSVDTYVNQVATGRSDPFAPITPPSVLVTAPIVRPDPPAPPPVQTQPLPPPVTTQPLPSQTPISGTDIETVRVDSELPPQPDVAAGPSSLARAIEISGIVEVGGNTNIIVRVPNEGTSRYVRVGEYIANGQILVKRVENQSGGDPIVILEENGIEVRRFIGSGNMSNDSEMLGSL